MHSDHLKHCKAQKYECEIRRNCLHNCFTHPVTTNNFTQVRSCYSEHMACWTDIRDGTFETNQKEKCNNMRFEDRDISC